MAGKKQAAAGNIPGRLILIPWHIGHDDDVSVSVLRTIRRLRAFVAEEPETSRQQFERLLPLGARGKLLLRIPGAPDPGFLREVVALLRREDVGLVASGGVPCFIDPGAWLVHELRERGVSIIPLGGPSCLTTVLSMSGLDWTLPELNVFTFVFFGQSETVSVRRELREALGRRGEPVVVFLRVPALRTCLEVLLDAGGNRRTSIFFDLTKPHGRHFPYADKVWTLTAREWLRGLARVRWERVSDIALLVHPAPGARPKRHRPRSVRRVRPRLPPHGGASRRGG
jgi:16S rRNA C1402 (ribose-2'-O) methylase RsmI